MSIINITDGSGLDLDANWGPNKGCQWNEDVCPGEPTHFICWADDSLDLLCGRHVVLTLAQLIEVHLHFCDQGFAEHVKSVRRM